MAQRHTVGEIAKQINDIACEGLVGDRTAAQTISFLATCVDKLLSGEFPDPDKFDEMLEERPVAA